MNVGHRVIEGYIHGGRIGVLVEIGLETSFTANTDEFANLKRDVVVHIAASNPSSVDALLAQPFVKDPSVSIRELVARVSTRLGERILVLRFVRWDTDSPVSPFSTAPPRDPAAGAIPLRRVGGRET